jgi:hypothetical protein
LHAGRCCPGCFFNQPISYSDSAKSLFNCGEKFFSAAVIQFLASGIFWFCSEIAALA